MKLRPDGVGNLVIMVAGAFVGIFVWTTMTFIANSLIEKLFSRSIDSFGIFFLLPYFFCGIALPVIFALYASHLARKGRDSSSVLKTSIQQQKLVIHTSRLEFAGSLLFASSFIGCPVITLFMSIVEPEAKIMLFIIGIPLGLFFLRVLSPRTLWSNAPQLVIDKNGIFNSRWSNPFIPWSEVTSIKIERGYRGAKIIAVSLKDPLEYHLTFLERHSVWSKNSLPINLIGLNKSTEEVWEFVSSSIISKKLISPHKS